MSSRNPASGGKLTSDLAVIGYIAGLKLILQLAAINGYGFFRDEFYYIACSKNLAFGYVDHPPLAMLLLKRNSCGSRGLGFCHAYCSSVVWVSLCFYDGINCT